jgi:hypothetical protein
MAGALGAVQSIITENTRPILSRLVHNGKVYLYCGDDVSRVERYRNARVLIILG